MPPLHRRPPPSWPATSTGLGPAIPNPPTASS